MKRQRHGVYHFELESLNGYSREMAALRRCLMYGVFTGIIFILMYIDL